MDRLTYFIVLFVFLNTQQIVSQESILVDETVFLHANTTTFVSGESLQYKIYCLKASDKTPSFISKVAYVELIDSEKKSVFKSKIALKNGTGNSDYFIPTSLSSGNYKLVAYTNWMLNTDISNFFTVDITIFNPYAAEALERTLVVEKNLKLKNSFKYDNFNKSSTTNKSITINLDKEIYKPRELVTLKIKSANSLFKDGNYSVTIVKMDELPTIKQADATDFITSQGSTSIDLYNQKNKIYVPELRGEIVTGKITAKNKIDQLENIAIALSVPGSSFDFKIVKTNTNGEFIFDLTPHSLNKQISLQIIGEEAKLYDIKLDKSPELAYSKLSFENSLFLPESSKKTLSNRSIASQIRNSYYASFKDSLLSPVLKTPFYYPTAKPYILDDFTRFKTLKETAIEIVKEIYLKQVDNNTFIHVNDPTIFPQLPEAALVLVDGMYLKNQNDLNKYSMKNVYKIEVIVGRYYLGPKSFNGLVSFTTFKNDFIPTENQNYVLNGAIVRPDQEKIYKKIEYSTLSQDKRIPDYRYQLLWEPNVSLSNDTTLLNFYTSDVTGKFQINMEGFNLNGQPISLFKDFEVN
ncbi:hypothetical protein ACRASX_02050 [Flavobacterium sp. TMP13]|uniref:hypothetical protein n=1 Tax=Flavobacterium sp. TMP13 TaxID=3425950 RepID=UPI003D77AB85